MAFNDELLSFSLHLEFGRRKCAVCKTQTRGLYVVNYIPNGHYKPNRYSVCVSCARSAAKEMSEKVVCAAKNAEAYMLGATL